MIKTPTSEFSWKPLRQDAVKWWTKKGYPCSVIRDADKELTFRVHLTNTESVILHWNGKSWDCDGELVGSFLEILARREP